MSAEVMKISGNKPFVAWCEECHAGLASGAETRPRAWAEAHNAKMHP